MHTVFVEVIEEVRLLTFVYAGQHVLRVQQGLDDSLQLYTGSHIWY